MRQSLATKATYWLKVVSLGMVLGLGLQFAQAWVAPAAAPPSGNVAGPITTGSSQAKAGALTTAGLAAPSFVDTDNAARYVNPSGTSVLWGLNIVSLPNCDLKTNAGGSVYCGTDATGGGSGDNLGNHIATQNLAMGGFKITNVANPTNAQDAATKAYVDGKVGSWANINNVPTGAVAAGCNVSVGISSGTSSEECWGGASVTIGSCGTTLTQSNCPAGTTRMGNIVSQWDNDHINCNRFGSFSCIKN